jgi:hypothetical protein
VTTPPKDAHRLLAAEPSIPEESATCMDDGPAWRRAVAGFADYAIELISLWPR